MKSIKDIKKIADINSEKNKQRFSLTVVLAVIIFVVLLAALAFATALVFIFSEVELIDGLSDELSLATIVICMIGFSVFAGAMLSLLLAKIPLKPINYFINCMSSLAAGNFKTRLKFNSSMANHKALREISDSFNKLAEELENTEMLRSDFINNFSHEFKTPIVSIAGLAKLLNRGNLTEEEKSKYLTAIEEESLRLATMATNVLNLTKVENQSILTDVSAFNLSEQIRSSVLLLENKWERKDVDPSVDFEEYTIEANEELLKEVWINLIDNAIKFSPAGTSFSISISELSDKLAIEVSNDGYISDDEKKKIFSKFYQIDKSHASEGSGVGLAIVKKIVDLHRGEISVITEGGKVTFKVVLPKKQKF